MRPLTEEEQNAMLQQMMAQQQAVQQAQQAALQQAETKRAAAAEGIAFDENDRGTWGNPGRNDPCPCGSGKKFKHCHGRY